LFVVCCLLFVVCCLLFVVCCLLFVVCCLLFVVLLRVTMVHCDIGVGVLYSRFRGMRTKMQNTLHVFSGVGGVAGS